MQDHTQKALWVSFLHVEGIGPGTLKRVIIRSSKLGFSLDEVWQMTSSLQLSTMGLSQKQQHALKEFKKNWSPVTLFESILQKGVEIVSWEDDCYSANLKPLDDPPLILYVRGNLELLSQTRAMAVVGTRKMTGYGVIAGSKIVKELVQDQFLIVSGFMYGVDTLAHQVAVEQGGTSIGVLGFGLDRLSSGSQRKFADKFLEAGNLLISEYPPDRPAEKENFPVRNRIVAGLALGTVVVEAKLKSGTHITVGKTLDYGREVFAVSGPVTSPYSEGTKKIINDGAHLITCGWEVCQYLREVSCLFSKGSKSQKRSFNSELEKSIYSRLQSQSLSGDELVEQLGLPISRINVALSMMEIMGLISRYQNKWQLVL